jgi:hypothetical protein
MRKGTRSGTGSSLPCQKKLTYCLRPRCGGGAYLIKSNSKVNVDDLSAVVIQEDVGRVAITETENMAHDRRSRHAARVAESHSEPRDRILVPLREVMSHDRFELLAQLGEQLDKGFCFTFALSPLRLQLAADRVSLVIVWTIPTQTVSQSR